MMEETKEKQVKTKDLSGTLKTRFEVEFNYQSIANFQRSVDQDLYRSQEEDAQKMLERLFKLKAKFPDFLGEILRDDQAHELKAVLYATSAMKELATSYMDLLVVDNTFNTNKYNTLPSAVRTTGTRLLFLLVDWFHKKPQNSFLGFSTNQKNILKGS